MNIVLYHLRLVGIGFENLSQRVSELQSSDFTGRTLKRTTSSL